MKKTLTTLLATAVLALVPAMFAADNDKPADKKKCCESCKDACKCEAGKCACDSKEKKVMLTGSHIPQTVTKLGRITDSMNPVSVYSREDLLQTGETDVASALRKLSPRVR